jgi:CheY-like chemotaxis protein
LAETSVSKPEEDAVSVLVMEDDDVERQQACRVLRRRGLIALEAKSGVEALKLYPASDVIWADISLPDQRGDQVVQAIHRRDSSKRVIFITGIEKYDDPTFKENLRLNGIKYDLFIRKPITNYATIYKLFEQIAEDRKKLREYLSNIKEALVRAKASDIAGIDKHESLLEAKDLVSGLWDQLENSQAWKKRLAIQLRLSLANWSVVPSESLGLKRPDSDQIDAFIAIVDMLSLSNTALTDELAMEKRLSKVRMETRLEIPQLKDILEDI